MFRPAAHRNSYSEQIQQPGATVLPVCPSGEARQRQTAGDAEQAVGEGREAETAEGHRDGEQSRAARQTPAAVPGEGPRGAQALRLPLSSTSRSHLLSSILILWVLWAHQSVSNLPVNLAVFGHFNVKNVVSS